MSSLELRFFLLLKILLTAVSSVKMCIPFLKERRLESSRSRTFRVRHLEERYLAD